VGLEKCVPREARLNQAFDYMLVVTNLTGSELHGVVVTDQPDDGFRFNNATPAPQRAGNKLTWAVGSLGPKESKTIKVNATAVKQGNIQNCATVEYASLLCASIPVVQPALKVTKTGPASVLKCDPIVYRFEVTNTGTGTINNVRITDPLPNGLLSKDGGQTTLNFNAGPLGGGQSRSFVASVEATRAGRFANTAKASGEGGMTATSGTVTTVVTAPALRISKECPDNQYIGRPTDYRITVTNTGDGEARNTIIEDRLPTGATFLSASDNGRAVGGTVRWDLGTMAAKASKTVTLRVSPGDAGTYRNTATARADCADPVSDSCETVVSGIPAILLEVIDIDDPIRVGGNETYVITVTNQGSAPGTNIVVAATLEATQQYVSSSGATQGTLRGNTVTFAPIGSLAPGAKATLRVVAKAVRPGDVRFSVTLNSDQLDRPVQENESTHQYE
jgi:uncharacterized repeat protein (TIGR01451 family)